MERGVWIESRGFEEHTNVCMSNVTLLVKDFNYWV